MVCARALVGGGCALRELVDPAVHVRVGGLVERAQRVEHLLGLLRRRGRVEVGERLPVDLLLEDREVGAKLARIELRAGSSRPWIYRTPRALPARRARVLTRRADSQRGTDPARAHPQAPASARPPRRALRRSILVDDGSSDGSYDLLLAVARERSSLQGSPSFPQLRSPDRDHRRHGRRRRQRSHRSWTPTPGSAGSRAADGGTLARGIRRHLRRPRGSPGGDALQERDGVRVLPSPSPHRNIDVPLDVGDFRLVDRRALEAFRRCARRTATCAECSAGSDSARWASASSGTSASPVTRSTT